MKRTDKVIDTYSQLHHIEIPPRKREQIWTHIQSVCERERKDIPYNAENTIQSQSSRKLRKKFGGITASIAGICVVALLAVMIITPHHSINSILGTRISIQVPSVGKVRSMSIGTGMPSPSKFAPWVMTNPNDKAKIKRVLRWLSSAKPVRLENPHRSMPTLGPTTLVITLKNGKQILIQPAFDVVTKHDGNKTTETGYYAKGYIDFQYSDSSRTIRLSSQRFDSWLTSNDWRKDFRPVTSPYNWKVTGKSFLIQGKIVEFNDKTTYSLKIHLDGVLYPGQVTPRPKFPEPVGSTVTVYFKEPFAQQGLMRPKNGEEVILGVTQYTTQTGNKPFWGSDASNYFYKKNGNFYGQNGYELAIAT